MISSLSAYGGYVANQLLSSAAANPAALPSTPSPDAFAFVGAVAVAAVDPAGAIRQILAHAQVSAAPSATLGGPDAAPVAQAAVPPPPSSYSQTTSISATQESADTSGVGLPVATNVSGDSVASAQGSVDAFHLAIALGGQSVSVDLAALGIGALSLTNSPGVWSAGDGAYGVGLHAGLMTQAGTGVNVETGVEGLTAAQAQNLAAAFEAASALPDQTISDVHFSSGGADYDDFYATTKLASGDTLQFSTSIAESLSQAG